MKHRLTFALLLSASLTACSGDDGGASSEGSSTASNASMSATEGATEGATSTTVAISTTTEGGIVGGLGSTTTTGLGQTGDGEDGTAGQDVLAYTGLKTNLAVAGVSLIAAGIALVVCGSYLDRRKLAVVHAAP